MLEKGQDNGLSQEADSKDAGSKDWALFGDFGAASNLLLLPTIQREAMESIEVRAFGCLLDDMLTQTQLENSELFDTLTSLSQACMQAQLHMRPSFAEITTALQALHHKAQDLADLVV
jgi:hypothetical protein